MRNLVFTIIAIFIGLGKILAQQYPITVIPQINQPSPVNLSDYANQFTINDPLKLTLILNDITFSNEQIRLKIYFEGHGISFQSRDVVVGVSPIFIDGGVPLVIEKTELAHYFEYQNITGINANVYAQSIPEGSYDFCFEVYSAVTGNRLSLKTCATTFIYKNEPPFLNLPFNESHIESNAVENIIFQWTPRHINVSNVEYELSIVEIWDNYVNPQTAFLTSVPIFQTTTRTTSFIYGPSLPLLLEGKRYAWRVKAKAIQGAEEIGLFRNEGESEIYWFSRTQPCEVLSNVYAEAKGTTKINVFWEENLNVYEKYTIAYREANNPDAEWFSITTNSSWATIWDLKPVTAYEYKVQGHCKFLSGNFSNIQEITTQDKEDRTANYECGIVPNEIAISNQEGHTSLQIGDNITAGDFIITLTEITNQSNGVISGLGFVNIPYLENARFGVEYHNILVNTDKRLAQGEIVTLYDSFFGADATATVDVDISIGSDKGEVDQIDVDFVIVSITTTENGTTVITGENEEEKIIPGGIDLVIVDSNETPWVVSEDGTVSEEEQAKGGPVTVSNTNGVDSDGVQEIASIGVRVDFVESGFYAYDKESLSASSALKQEYSVIKIGDEDYQVPYKAVSSTNGDDILIAKANISNKDYSVSDIIFKTTKGVKIEAIWKNNEATLKLKQNFDYVTEEVLATVVSKEDKEKQDVVGVFNLVHLSKLDVNLVIVPLNNASIENGIESDIKEIYNKVGVDFNITINPALDISNINWDENNDGKLEVGTSDFLSNYSDEEKVIISHLKTLPEYNSETYYVFISDLPISETSADGFMPLKSQYGFVFQSSNQAHITAHELGHGVFGFEHPFEEYKTTKADTDLLMDYKGGTLINHMDWKKIHAPEFKLYWFQDEEDALYGTENPFLSTDILKLLRCQYANESLAISQELYERLNNLSAKRTSENSNFALRTMGDLVVPDGGTFKSVSSLFVINYKENPTYLKPASSVTYSKTDDSSYAFNFGDIDITVNELSIELLFGTEDPEAFKDYITLQNEYSNSQSLIAYVNTLLKDNELSSSDIDILIDLTNCELAELTAESRFKILELLSKKWTLFEERENLVLNILQSTEQPSYDTLLYNLQQKPDVYKIIFERVNAGDNEKHLLDELFTIWSGSKYYEPGHEPQYHNPDSGNYNTDKRNDEFYREFQKEIEVFIYSQSTPDCFNNINSLSAIELNNCIRSASSNGILSISLEDRKMIIEKFLETPTEITTHEFDYISGGASGFQQSIIRLIKFLPDNVNKDDFITYLTNETVTRTTVSAGGEMTSNEIIITALFSATNDSGFFKGPDDNRKELVEAFQNLKFKSKSFEDDIQAFNTSIEDFDIDAYYNQKGIVYNYDYRNILKRFVSELSFELTEEDFYWSLETEFSSISGTPKVSITQLLKGGLFASAATEKAKQFNPFDLIIFVNLSELPLLSDFSTKDVQNKNAISFSSAILAHYAVTVGDAQTQSDIIQTGIDVGSLVIPGGQLNALGKLFYYSDKISSLASLAATYKREDTEVAEMLNKISMATGLVSIGDLATNTTAAVLKNNANTINSLKSSDIANSLEEQAKDAIEIIEKDPNQLVSGTNEVLADMFENEKLALGDEISPSQIAKVDEAIIALRTKVVVSTNYEFEKLGYTYKSVPVTESDGSERFEYFLKKEGEEYKLFGHSILTKDGVLKENTLVVPEAIQGKEVSKAVYADVLKNDVKIIKSEYPNDEPDFSHNYDAFMGRYDIDENNLEEAALATPAGKVLGQDWIPTEIKVNGDGITLNWVKRSEYVENIDANSYKNLSDEIEQLYLDPNELYSASEVYEKVQNLIAKSSLPKDFKDELAKIDDNTELKNIIRIGKNELFDLANSQNEVLANYAIVLAKSRRYGGGINDDKTFKYLISQAETVHTLEAAKNTDDITNGSGGIGIIISGDVNGKQTIFKLDENVDYDVVTEMEMVTKALEDYGGAKYYGRYRVQMSNGVWREVIGMEPIQGYDLMAIINKASQGNPITDINIGQMHLDAIDNVVAKLAANNKVFHEVNLGDFMLTNDPNRPIVFLDMFVKDGDIEQVGLMASGKKVRKYIEDLIPNANVSSRLENIKSRLHDLNPNCK